MIKVNIVADSISEVTGKRITSLECTFPRHILAEVNTHRMLSRNSASSRAIPVKRMIEMVKANPYIPDTFYSAKKGMQGGEPIQYPKFANNVWEGACCAAIRQAVELDNLGVHKSQINRLLEPFMWHTSLITATEWDNFFNLRMHEAAEPNFQILATEMYHAMDGSSPQVLAADEWHTPYVDSSEALSWERLTILQVSVGRCARLSYLTQHGDRDYKADVRLAEKLRTSGHMSPFEHQAQVRHVLQSGNFMGWAQLRKMIAGEEDMLSALPLKNKMTRGTILIVE